MGDLHVRRLATRELRRHHESARDTALLQRFRSHPRRQTATLYTANARHYNLTILNVFVETASENEQNNETPVGTVFIASASRLERPKRM